MKKKRYLLAAIALLALGALGFLASLQLSKADVSSEAPSVTEGRFRTYSFFSTTTKTAFNDFSATTTNATSTNIIQFSSNFGVDKGYFVIAGAKKVTLFFQRGDTTGTGNTGTSTFRIQSSPDGTNWYNFNKLKIASSTAQTAITNTVGRVILSAAADFDTATATIVASLDIENDSFYAIRCIVVEGTDGEHSCKASANW